MRVELGGGRSPKPGYINLDVLDTADIRHDLNSLPWPLQDNSVTALYSSHCLEHLNSPDDIILEIGRVCAIGATVVIRVPDALSEGASCPGHTCVLGETWWRNALEHFPSPEWAKMKKRLRIVRIERRPDPLWYPRAQRSSVFQGWTAEDILRWVPRTCHEIELQMEVVGG